MEKYGGDCGVEDYVSGVCGMGEGLIEMMKI